MCLKVNLGTSLVAQRLRLCASTEGSTGSTPIRELKTPHAVPHSQMIKNKQIKVNLHSIHLAEYSVNAFDQKTCVLLSLGILFYLFNYSFFFPCSLLLQNSFWRNIRFFSHISLSYSKFWEIFLTSSTSLSI